MPMPAEQDPFDIVITMTRALWQTETKVLQKWQQNDSKVAAENMVMGA